MKNVFLRSALLAGLLGLGTGPVLAGHYGDHGKTGYGHHKGMAYGKHCGKMHGHHKHAYGKGYGKGDQTGHWDKGYMGWPHRHGWAKGPRHYGYGHPMMRGYGGNYGHDKSSAGYGYPKAPKKTPGAAPEKPAQHEAPSTKPTNTVAPAAPRNIVDTAVAADAFATLVSAVKAADLAETLSGEGPFTVFAPTDEAFNKLPEGTVPGLLNNTDALTKVLTYHVVAGRLDAATLVEQGEFETLNGAKLTLGQLNVAQADIAASNGIIHILDDVLLPPGS